MGPEDPHPGVHRCLRLGGAVQAGARGLLSGKKIICLNIANIYSYIEAALIDELNAALRGHVEVPEQ